MALLLGLATATLARLIVDVAPSTPKPYVLRNLQGSVVDFGGLIIRTIVSNDPSEGAFSLLNVNSGPSPIKLVHYHEEVEAFYALKGAVNVWRNSDTGRDVQANDFALLAPYNNHTYQPTDLDFQPALCMTPGGIDVFFAAAGEAYTGEGPFNPVDHSQLDAPKVLSLMPKFNIVPNPTLSTNNNWENGTTADGQGTWHVADQSLPSGSDQAYFISSNRGPKFLHQSTSQVIGRLASGVQTGGTLFVATIVMPPS